MPRIAIFFAAILFFFTPHHHSAMAQMEKKQGPVSVTFTNPYGDVTFDHESHSDFTCSACHPLFDFEFDDGKGYSRRAHGECIACHKRSEIETDCASCHEIKQRKTIPFAKSILASPAPSRQAALDFFYKRRSIRKYQKKGISDALVTDILKAAMAAPSAGNWQPWEFVVVRDAKTQKRLADTSPFAGFAQSAPVVIAIAGQNSNAWSPYDCALAAGNILLAAANMGLGATYAGFDEEREVKVRAILNIPDTHTVYSLIPIGYPAEFKAPHTKYNTARIHMEKFETGRPETIMGNR